MKRRPTLVGVDAVEFHNQIANRIVAQILDEPIAAGGSMSDVMMLFESVVVGVVGSCFPPDTHVQALDAIVSRANERLAKAWTEQGPAAKPR